MLASLGVNPLATSYTVKHLSSTCLHNKSHDQPIMYLISHCLNKIDMVWNPGYQYKKKVFQYCQKSVIHVRLYLVDVTLQKKCLKIYAAPSRGRQKQ